jgi:small conductance mechanosensitive channel
MSWVITEIVRPAASGLILLGAILLIARFVRRAGSQWMARRKLDPQVALLVSRCVYLGLVALGVYALIATVLASAATALWGVIVAVAVASLGIQDVFRNYVSGFYILLERNVQVGDHVETDGQQGVVTEVKLRVTQLRGKDGQVIIVPNSELFSKTAVIWPPAGQSHESGQDDSD